MNHNDGFEAGTRIQLDRASSDRNLVIELMHAFSVALELYCPADQMADLWADELDCLRRSAEFLRNAGLPTPHAASHVLSKAAAYAA
ncbi:MAG: hypothetical protein ACM3W4_09575 [Ignavibacteriales bacterium]